MQCFWCFYVLCVFVICLFVVVVFGFYSLWPFVLVTIFLHVQSEWGVAPSQSMNLYCSSAVAAAAVASHFFLPLRACNYSYVKNKKKKEWAEHQSDFCINFVWRRNKTNCCATCSILKWNILCCLRAAKNRSNKVPLGRSSLDFFRLSGNSISDTHKHKLTAKQKSFAPLNGFDHYKSKAHTHTHTLSVWHSHKT